MRKMRVLGVTAVAAGLILGATGVASATETTSPPAKEKPTSAGSTATELLTVLFKGLGSGSASGSGGSGSSGSIVFSAPK
ncbi:hypothetical protein [Nocardia crassostreae]|uniref:hypothetical protein n=1 Tax=Nocardia crassostreae TaxID=53428 RepID=UPI000AC2776A|nr:hypothetical protein [Nocardia crassostreae]